MTVTPDAYADRFWSKVEVLGPDECWLNSHVPSDRYGQYGPMRAHVFSYLWHYGDLQEDLQVLHSCDTPRCVNPNHLFLGTQGDNMKDMALKGRSCSGSRNGQSKLSESDVREIRSSGLSQSRLAEKYGVSQTLVSKIKLGKVWAHV